MDKLAEPLIKNNYSVINWDYDSRANTIQDSASKLEAIVQKKSKIHSVIHFVTHSLGGIIVRRLLNVKTIDNVGCFIMIATPNQGSYAARVLLRNPVLHWFYGPAGWQLGDPKIVRNICGEKTSGKAIVIAGTKNLDLFNPTSWFTQVFLGKGSDGTNTVDETWLEGCEHYPVPCSHTFIVCDPEVIYIVVNSIEKYKKPQ